PRSDHGSCGVNPSAGDVAPPPARRPAGLAAAAVSAVLPPARGGIPSAASRPLGLRRRFRGAPSLGEARPLRSTGHGADPSGGLGGPAYRSDSSPSSRNLRRIMRRTSTTSTGTITSTRTMDPD